MNEVQQLLERQAAWQKGRKALSWPEKIRMVEAIGKSVLHLRRGGPRTIRGATGSRWPEKAQ